MLSNFVFFFLKKHTFKLQRLFKYLPKFSSATFMNSAPTFKYLINLAFGKFGNVTFFSQMVSHPNHYMYLSFSGFFFLFYSIGQSDHSANDNVIG